MRPKFLAVVMLIFGLTVLATAQTPGEKSSVVEPALPVITDKACPFEGCTFRKWIVSKDVILYSTWRKDRKQVAMVKPGLVVTGITGVHITYEPDRIQVLNFLPELGVQNGDTILRYMYHGEGVADIWAKGRWWKEYDCSFISEKDGLGCRHHCAAKVISDGRKEWWVQVRTADGLLGWTKAAHNFDCMDSLGGDPKCDNLGAILPPPIYPPFTNTNAGRLFSVNLHADNGQSHHGGTEFQDTKSAR